MEGNLVAETAQVTSEAPAEGAQRAGMAGADPREIEVRREKREVQFSKFKFQSDGELIKNPGTPEMR